MCYLIYITFGAVNSGTITIKYSDTIQEDSGILQTQESAETRQRQAHSIIYKTPSGQRKPLGTSVDGNNISYYLNYMLLH